MNRFDLDIQSIVEEKHLFSTLKDSNILITGATGLIGSVIVKTLQKANIDYSLGIKIKAQIRNPQKAIHVFNGYTESLEFTDNTDVEADYIIHTLSPTKSRYFIEHPVETIKTSIDYTISVLETAKKYDSNVVYLSSMEQYGIPFIQDKVMREDDVGMLNHLDVRSSYPESKRLCECLCSSYANEYNVNVKIARLSQTFGAGAPLFDNRMPMQFSKAVVENKDIILHTEGKSISNFVYLTDAITGILTILNKGARGQAYNICNDKESRSVYDIAKLVATDVACGKIGVKIDIPKYNMGYAPDSHMFLDSGKLIALGWQPKVSMVEAYSRLVEYLLEQHE